MRETVLTLNAVKRSRTAFVSSLFLHGLGALLVFQFVKPEADRTHRMHSTTLYLPPSVVAPIAKATPVRAAMRLFYPPGSVTVPRTSSESAAPPKPPELRALDAAIPPPPAVAIEAPSAPVSAPTIGSFPSVPAAQAKPVRLEPRLQTAEFASTSARNAPAIRASEVETGSFAGQSVGRRAPDDRKVTTSSGFADAVSGRRDTVESRAPQGGAGFGDAIAARPSHRDMAAVAASQFGSMTAAAPRSGKTTSGPRSRAIPLEILRKPRPEYSNEARALQLEGEVLLEALFGAGGDVRVLRIVRGLGHGLDENAARAASAIRFRPAMEDGKPVDTVADVRIEFQLAY